MTAVKKYVCHSKVVLGVAAEYGWLPGARYTNLRDVRQVSQVGFLDIQWKDYSFERHMAATRLVCPKLTVARDVTDIANLSRILDEAEQLLAYASSVIVVPKDPKMSRNLCEIVPEKFILGYSVPTRYGGTTIPVEAFDGRPVHLLGGRPDHQRRLADQLNVVSVDTNRFTLDAAFGDYFDGETFRPHPVGGYIRCLSDSFANINFIWANYRGPRKPRGKR